MKAKEEEEKHEDEETDMARVFRNPVFTVEQNQLKCVPTIGNFRQQTSMLLLGHTSMVENFVHL